MKTNILVRHAHLDDAKGIFIAHKRSIAEICAKDYSTSHPETLLELQVSQRHKQTFCLEVILGIIYPARSLKLASQSACFS